jgi:hypothetical protein
MGFETGWEERKGHRLFILNTKKSMVMFKLEFRNEMTKNITYVKEERNKCLFFCHVL